MELALTAQTHSERAQKPKHSPTSTKSAKGIHPPLCDPCKASKRRCTRGSPCLSCRSGKILCTLPTKEKGKTHSHGHSAAEFSVHSHHQPSLHVYSEHGIGGQFFSAIQTLLRNEKEELLQLAWSVWQQRQDLVVGELRFTQALRNASRVLSEEKYRTSGHLAATILLANYAIYKHQTEHLKLLLHSIQVLIEARNNIDFGDEVGRRLLPMSSLFVLYSAVARHEDIRESMPSWDKCFRGPAQTTTLAPLAALPRQMRLATAEEFSNLARSTLAKTSSLWDAYVMASPQEKPLVAEDLIVYCCFSLEILKRANETYRLRIAQQIHSISTYLQEFGLGGHCVASFPLWHAQTLVHKIWNPSPGNEGG